MEPSIHRPTRGALLDTLSITTLRAINSPATVVAGYGVARCAGAYLSLCAITTLSSVELGMLALLHSGLWWISLMTAGGIRMACIAQSAAVRDQRELCDAQAELFWIIFSVIASAVLLMGLFIIESRALLCSGIWCYTGALWNDWYCARAARDKEYLLQSILLICGALVQALCARFFVQYAGVAGALAAQGIVYWVTAIIGWSVYPRSPVRYTVVRVPARAIAYVPGLLYSWMSACATRWILFVLYGAQAVGEWVPIEMLIAPFITAASTLMMMLYMPRLLSGEYTLKHLHQHVLYGAVFGFFVSGVLLCIGYTPVVALSALYTVLLCAIAARMMWTQRAGASFYERLLPLFIALIQGIAGAVVWPLLGVIGMISAHILCSIGIILALLGGEK